ncbi:exo-alpha-sialidase, partial [Helicobacter aurati]
PPPPYITKTSNNQQGLLTTSNFIINPEDSAHASALLRRDSTLMALFYAGSREGARDVKIYQSFLDLDSENEWRDTQVLLTPQQLSKLSGRFIKKLGNPIIFKDTNDKVYFFVVGVSLGGWATSRIYQFSFDDTLKNIHYIKELHLSPFGNYSHLIRTPAMILENGGFYLPISHEMWHKFPLIAYFDEHGNMIFTKRINNLKAQLQPTFVPVNDSDCVSLFRTNNRYNMNAYFQTCSNYGNQWNEVITSNLFNYDSSVLLVNIGGEVLLIHNDGKHNPLLQNADKPVGDRQSLSLYYLQNNTNGHFVYLTTIDFAPRFGEVSYPSAALSEQHLHIAYTYNRQTIKHVSIKLDSLLELIESSRIRETNNKAQ